MNKYTRPGKNCVLLTTGVSMFALGLLLCRITRRGDTEGPTAPSESPAVQAAADRTAAQEPSIPVVFNDSEPTLIPPNWITDQGFSYTVAPDSQDVRDWISGAIEDELSKYNLGELRRHVRQIVVVSTMTFSGVWAAGTEGNATVWLALQDGQGVPATEEYLRGTLHHEIGSVLYRTRQWDDWPVPAGHYPDNGFEAIRSGQGNSLMDYTRLSTGFVSQYGMVSQHKDICTIHECCMMSPSLMRRVSLRHPALRQKVEAWKRGFTPMGVVRPQVIDAVFPEK